MPAAEPGPLRIGFVVHEMQVAGAEILIDRILRSLADQIRPTIVCLDAVGELGRRLAARGVEVLCLERRPGLDLRAAWRLRRVARERRFELVHAHQYTPFFYAAVARLLGRRYRLALTEHGRHYPDRVGARRFWANRLLLARQAESITACSRFSCRALAVNDGFPPETIQLIPNGIDAAGYGPAADRSTVLRRLGLPPSRRHVATVARFHPVKDHATLLRAFSQVARRLSDVDLLLVGDGPLRPALEEQVAEAGLGGRVHFLGVRDDVPTVLSAVDLFCLSSVSEAASLTLLEAMASGLPVLVTAVGGNPEIVRDGIEGRLVPRGESEALADVMQRLLTEDDLPALGAAARARVLSNYRLRDTVEAYARLYGLPPESAAAEAVA